MRRGLLVTVLLALTLGACGTIPENDPLRPAVAGEQSAASTQSDSSTPAADRATSTTGAESCEYEPTGDAARSVRPPSPTGVATSGAISYDLDMTEGTVRITLDPVRAPCTVHSFVSLAEQGFFDETRCHRLVDSSIFLFQCGDPTGTGRGGPGYTLAPELDGTESYTKGVVAMANDGSQFFLVYRDSTALDKTPDYTIFGDVDASGIPVLERMAAEGQDGKNPEGGGRPNNPSEIVKATRVGG